MGPRGGMQTRPFPTPIPPHSLTGQISADGAGVACIQIARLRDLWAAGGRIALDQCSTTQAPNPLRFDLLNSDLAGEGLCWEGGMLGFLWPGQ